MLCELKSLSLALDGCCAGDVEVDHNPLVISHARSIDKRGEHSVYITRTALRVVSGAVAESFLAEHSPVGIVVVGTTHIGRYRHVGRAIVLVCFEVGRNGCEARVVETLLDLVGIVCVLGS